MDLLEEGGIHPIETKSSYFAIDFVNLGPSLTRIWTSELPFVSLYNKDVLAARKTLDRCRALLFSIALIISLVVGVDFENRTYFLATSLLHFGTF